MGKLEELYSERRKLQEQLRQWERGENPDLEAKLKSLDHEINSLLDEDEEL